MVPSPSTT
ncbi:hypothetical protein E2C01_034659 [Portunus trituberculatus]|uniref:Uncharacterized protein n=1 Tax=Portunus trituberculatus TaxID=210409 RepID=A0A5B7F7I7_PORTR|nr:hypothetical protein [Portunus trituberculatus]